MSKYGVWLSLLGLELAFHNCLYDRHAIPLLSDHEYDFLNKKYFDTCASEGESTAKGLIRDSGMMEEGSVKTMVYSMEQEKVLAIAQKLRKERLESIEWKDLTSNK